MKTLVTQLAVVPSVARQTTEGWGEAPNAVSQPVDVSILPGRTGMDLDRLHIMFAQPFLHRMRDELPRCARPVGRLRLAVSLRSAALLPVVGLHAYGVPCAHHLHRTASLRFAQNGQDLRFAEQAPLCVVLLLAGWSRTILMAYALSECQASLIGALTFTILPFR